jgi:hypothetical protein
MRSEKNLSVALVAAAIVLGVLFAASGCSLFVSSEGTEGEPIQLGDATAGTVTYEEGQVAGSEMSYYSVDVAGGTEYTVSATEVTADVGLWLFADAGFRSPMDRSRNDGAVDETVTVTTIADATKLYIRVDAETDTGARYTITVQ